MPARHESTWTVVSRCLVMLRRLQRGPATKHDLMAEVAAAIPEAYGAATGRALTRRFESDKARLRETFGLELRYRRSTREYELVATWEPLLDLPDSALAAMAFLQETFEPRTPNDDLVQELISLLISYLAPERRRVLEQERTALAVAWGQRDADEIAPDVEQGLRKALVERRLVAFDYLSPRQADGAQRRHVVEPWERYFDSARGHYYLHGFCRQTTSPAHGVRAQHRYFHYRLGRIANLTVLPDKLPPTPPRVAKKPLVYRLAPEIARRGDVTRHPGINILETAAQEDGSVIVTAETGNVWWAVRTLLHYGHSCEILEGLDALYEVRQVVDAMAELYGT